MSAPLEATGLGKHFRRGWALRDCTLTIPEGAIVGLAGPNGAGKSTLLGLAVGLFVPDEGQISVFGWDPQRDPEVLPAIGYVPQNAPLYKAFTVAETLEFARVMNEQWDGGLAAELTQRIRTGARVGTLTPGERSRLALALALGKRPALLMLDEPFARLDPLAGREFLQTLMDGVAETGTTVVIASHVVADIERVCDHIVLLANGHVRLEGNVDELLGSHRLLTGARRPMGTIHGVEAMVRERYSGRQSTLLVRTNGPVLDPTWQVDEIRLADLLLAYMAPERLPAVQQPAKEPGRLRWHG
jgi:ABC-2 type transport system ATP-binding protein